MDLLLEFKKACQKYKNKTALLLNDNNITYYYLSKALLYWEQCFKELKIEKGSKIIIWVDDLILFIELFLTIWENNCVVIPITHDSPSKEIENLIKSSACDYIFYTNNKKIKLSKKTSKKVISENVSVLQLKNKNRITNNKCSLFLYTSGTTGQSKCVWFTKENFTKNIVFLKEKILLSHKDICYTPISLFLPSAMNTILWPSLIAGATVIVKPTIVPNKINNILSSKNVSVFFSVPYFYEKYVQSNMKYDNNVWRNVRLCLFSSSLLSIQLYEDFYKKTNKKLHSIYCSSEAGVIAYSNFKNKLPQNKLLLKPMKEVELKINDNTINSIGEIQVKSNLAASGYFTNMEGFTYFDSWLTTSDIGKLFSNDLFEVLGRKDDVINFGGFLVFPAEIESVLLQHDKIEECQVYEGKFNGNIYICADIVCHNLIGFDEIYNFCANKLSYYKIPKKIFYVESIDRGRYGKIFKKGE